MGVPSRPPDDGLMKHIYVPVTPQTLTALVRLADLERRRIHVQAAILLERALGTQPGEDIQQTEAPRQGPAREGRAA